MSKILLFACLGSFVLSPVAQAQCVNVRFVSSGVGSLIQLLGTGISTSQLTAAAGYWATCPSYGTGFPRFTTDNVSADAQVTVVYSGGSGTSCGLTTHSANNPNVIQIQLWDRGLDTAGHPYDCNVVDTLAHELGHVLDLDNSTCPGYIMGPTTLSTMNGHEVAGTRSVNSQECSTVSNRWTTSFDQSGGGVGTPDFPPPCD